MLREVLAGEGGDSTISHIYIGRVRDAFAELLKERVRKLLQARVSVAAMQKDVLRPTVYLTHIHDEASMRFRSFEQANVATAIDGPVLNRGRYSKVQNNAVLIGVGDQGKLEWPTELQPLMRKDGSTIATAIVSAVAGALEAAAAAVDARGARPVTFLHMLIGDGVNTNENAAKKVLQHFMFDQRHPKLKYRLLVWKCASHQANLVVAVAISGKVSGDVLRQSELCATLSRLYKYLVPSYLPEFSMTLRNLVASTFVMSCDTDSAATVAHQEMTKKLVALYGERVLPPELTRIRNRDLGAMQHVAPAGASFEVARKDMYDVLMKLVWIVEERPVVTRLFLFAPCCFALCRMFLLKLPVELF
jgi:hypothetical protein